MMSIFLGRISLLTTTVYDIIMYIMYFWKLKTPKNKCTFYFVLLISKVLIKSTIIRLPLYHLISNNNRI